MPGTHTPTHVQSEEGRWMDRGGEIRGKYETGSRTGREGAKGGQLIIESVYCPVLPS